MLYKMNLKNVVLLFTLLLSFTSCDKENVITLEVENTQVEFTHNGASEKYIQFYTNAKIVNVRSSSVDNWCKASIDNDKIKITVAENNETESYRSTTLTVEAEGANKALITVTQAGKEAPYRTFVIKADKNNLQNDIIATIDEDTKTIKFRTNEWIGSVKNLIVDFDLRGEVYVNNELQTSGESTQSFLEELIYTVKGEDNSDISYKVVPSGPMFTGLPVVSIYIDGNKEVIEKKTKLPASFNLIDIEQSEFDMSNVEMTIRGRGNSTWGMPKKPYRVDFPSKTSLFGLPKAKKWVFLANYQDPTFLMNDIAFELGRRFGLEFNHSSIHVELFVNGKYRGNYQMTEQKETGKGRVDINTDGGFLVELDVYFDEDYQFESDYFKLPVMVQGPKLSNESEMDYIKDAIHEFEKTLYGDNFPNDDYEQYTDVRSLINFMLINELLRNQELHHPKSTYLYKEADSKIKWGPLWDFDWGFGYNGGDRYFVRNDLLFYADRAYQGDDRAGLQFFCRFFEIPSFREKYYAQWKEMKPKAESILEYIDSKAKELEKSQAENFNIADTTPNTKNTTYSELISQMKSWLQNRINFLDKELTE